MNIFSSPASCLRLNNGLSLLFLCYGRFGLVVTTMLLSQSFGLDSPPKPNDCHGAIPFPAWRAAQQLQPPQVDATDQGEAEGLEWWIQHESLLQMAWKDWEMATNPSGGEYDVCDPPYQTHPPMSLPPLNTSLINPDLVARVQKVWDDPMLHNEGQVYDSWNKSLQLPEAESASEQQVFRYDNLFTLDGVVALRRHLDAIGDSGIPIRRPNGMNRYGVLLDPSVPGAVGRNLPLVEFLDMLVADLVRPLGRLFFPNHVGSDDDDALYYGFTIRYGDEEDMELKEHTDASVVTMNLNLNLPDEGGYEGSSIYFVTEHDEQQHSDEGWAKNKSRKRHELTFQSGTALIHRGMVRHGAMPISRGSRHNLVLWLYGKDGTVRFAPYAPEEQLSVKERWSRATSSSPFSSTSSHTCSIENSIWKDGSIGVSSDCLNHEIMG